MCLDAIGSHLPQTRPCGTRSPQLLLLADNEEASDIEFAWKRVPHRQSLQRINAKKLAAHLQGARDRCFLTVATSWRELSLQQPLSRLLENFDPRHVQLLSPAGLFERQQERLPPILLPEGWMAYDEMPWAAAFGLQTRIKRTADILFSILLLICAAQY